MRLYAFLPVFFGFVCLSNLYAQQDFTDGGFLRPSGDTVRGQIDYREWDRTPAEIRFRRSPDARIETITPENAAVFFISGKNEVYRTASIYLNDEASDTRNMPSFSSKREALTGFRPVRHKVFLRLLADGKLALLEYNDSNRRHFLVQPEGDTIRELLARRVSIGGSVVSLDDYKNQLRLLTAACPALKTNFDRLPYFENALLDVVLKYNRCAGKSSYTRPESKAARRMYLVAGVGLPLVKAGGPFSDNKPIDGPGNIAPLFGAGADFSFQRAKGRRGAGAELYFTRYTFETDRQDIFGRNVRYDMEVSYLRLLAFFRQDIFKSRLQPYLKAGIGAGYFLNGRFDYSRETTTGNPTELSRPLQKNDICFFGGLGIKTGRIAVECRYESGSNIAEFNASENVNSHLLSLTAAWNFSR